MDTEVTGKSLASILNRYPLTVPSRLTGMEGPSRIGSPMSTCIKSPFFTGLMIPARVSTASSLLPEIPLSQIYFAKHLMPLPHISTCEPSATASDVLQNADLEG